MKKISVIVPIYNVCEYLDRVITSLIDSTYKNLEIILIDDGSTDDSGKICDKYKSIDKRIKVIHKKNEGVSVARNVGLKEATGDFIGFVDSDDLISKDMFKILFENIIKTNSDISICNYITFKDNLPKYTISNNVQVFNKIDSLKELISDGKITNFLWNKLFKKELFNDIDFPRGKIYEDMYILPKVFEKIERICYTDSKLYGYYQRQNSYVNTYNEIKNKNYLEFSKEIYSYLLQYKELKEELNIYHSFYIYSAFLQAAKSKCLDIFKSEYMKEIHKEFKKQFIIDYKYTLKRKMLYYLLYINRYLFYIIVSKIA